MADTRDFKSLGEFAVDADEVQPPDDETPRVPGQSYRNTKFTTFQQNQGKQFGLVPVSENFNQQIYNASQFTNLIDRAGIPDWRFDVEYNIPAAVWGSDNKLYKCIRNGNINVDPITEEDPENPEWWGEFVSLQEIGVDYTSQELGNEGASHVGATFTPFFNAIPEGKTLQDSLKYEADRMYKMHNLRVLAYFNGSVSGSGVINTIGEFNIDTINVVNYYIPTTPGSDPTVGYITINYTNNIPTPYLYSISINPRIFIISTAGFVVNHSSSSSVADATASSIKIGLLTLMNKTIPTWGFEDGFAREQWNINFYAYEIDT